jgi:integrase/recombinase XerD
LILSKGNIGGATRLENHRYLFAQLSHQLAAPLEMDARVGPRPFTRHQIYIHQGQCEIVFCFRLIQNQLIQNCDVQPDTLVGVRNRALLSLGYDFLARRSELVAIQSDDLKFTTDGALKGMIRKSKTDQYGRGRLVFGSTRSAKLVRKWIKTKPIEIQPVFCAINHNRCLDRAICDRQVNEIIKRSIVRVKRCERPSDLEVSGHSLRVGAAQDLLIKGFDLAAIMRAGGWSDPTTVSRYLQYSQHNIWS